MPPIRSSSSNRYNWLVTTILSLSVIIPSYSRYIEKKLVYIIITVPSGRQPSSYAKCTRVNIQLFCNVRSVSNAKYIRLVILYRRLVPYLTYYRVLYLIRYVLS
jgi:hypothetical protein